MILARKEVKRLLEDMERLVAEDPESYLRFSQSRQDKDKWENIRTYYQRS